MTFIGGMELDEQRDLPWKPTWNLKNGGLYMCFLFQPAFFKFHVSCRGVYISHFEMICTRTVGLSISFWGLHRRYHDFIWFTSFLQSWPFDCPNGGHKKSSEKITTMGPNEVTTWRTESLCFVSMGVGTDGFKNVIHIYIYIYTHNILYMI